MITVLSNSYTDDEKKAIHKALVNARSEFLKEFCGEAECSQCSYRHVCYDLDKVTDFTLKLKRSVEDDKIN